MASITVRNIPDAVHRALRLRAAAHGRSTEAEVRDILAKTAMPQDRLKDAQPPQALYLTSINAAELWASVAILPNDARKRGLEVLLDNALGRLFAGRKDLAAKTWPQRDVAQDLPAL